LLTCDKAVSEQGERLNIRKATLREWRREFARHLRDHGIAANATERAVRGETRTHKKDGIYRAAERGDSTHMRSRAQTAASELAKGSLLLEHGKPTLAATRKDVERGWRALSDILVRQGEPTLALQVRRFSGDLPTPLTENERLASKVLRHTREPRVR